MLRCFRGGQRLLDFHALVQRSTECTFAVLLLFGTADDCSDLRVRGRPELLLCCVFPLLVIYFLGPQLV
jgi:hypothetical protein